MSADTIVALADIDIRITKASMPACKNRPNRAEGSGVLMSDIGPSDRKNPWCGGF